MFSWLLAKSPALFTAAAGLGLLAQQAAEGVQIGTDSVVTIGLLIVIVGAAVYLTRENTMLKNAAASAVERANQQDKRLDRMSQKLDRVYEDYIVRIRREQNHEKH